MITREFYLNWLSYYYHAYAEVFWLLTAAFFLSVTIGYLFREGWKSQNESERLAAYLAAKYPPITPEQQSTMEADVRAWERAQFQKEGGK